MSDGQIAVEMSLKESKFITGLLNAARAQDKVEDNFTKIAREAAKAEADIKRFADSTTKINAAPVDAYNSQMEKLDASLKKNLISQETYNRAVERAKKELSEADGSAKRFADEQSRLAAETAKAEAAQNANAEAVRKLGEQITRINATPIEVYNQKVQELDNTLKAGAISQDTYSRAVERAKKEMAEADGSAKLLADQEARLKKEAQEAAAAVKRESDEVKKFADETRKVNATPIEKYREQVVRLDAALKSGTISQETYTRAVGKAKNELQEAHDKALQAAGPSMNSSVAALAATWFTVQGAVQLAGEAMQHAKQETMATLEAVKQLSNVNRALNQISGSPRELAANQKRADKIAAESGVDRTAARDALTMAKNEGWDKDFEKIASSWQSLDTKSASIVAGQVPGMFGDGKINSLESVNFTLAAARESRLNPADFASAMPAAAEGAVPAGTSPEQLFALMAGLSVKYSSASTGADRLRGFGTKLAMNKEFEGKSYLEAADMMSKDDVLREKILGKDQETNMTLKALMEKRNDIVRLESMLKDERKWSGTSASSLEIANSNALANPELRSEREIAIAKNRMEIARQEEKLAGGTANEVAINKAKETLYRQGVSPTGIWMGEKASEAARLVGMSDSMVEAAGLGFGIAGDTNTINPMKKAGLLSRIKGGYLDQASTDNSQTLGPITQDEIKANSKRSADAMERMEKLIQEQNEILKQSKATQTDNSRNQTRAAAAMPSPIK